MAKTDNRIRSQVSFETEMDRLKFNELKKEIHPLEAMKAYDRTNPTVQNDGVVDVRDILKSLGLSPEERATVDKALLAGDKLTEMLKDGLVKVAKSRNQYRANILEYQGLSYREIESKRQSKGAPYALVNKLVEAIQHHNDHCTDNADRMYIGETLVFTITGCNRKVISQYFEDHQTAIDEHNGKYDLNKNSNRNKGKKGNEIKADLGL